MLLKKSKRDDYKVFLTSKPTDVIPITVLHSSLKIII